MDENDVEIPTIRHFLFRRRWVFPCRCYVRMYRLRLFGGLFGRALFLVRSRLFSYILAFSIGFFGPCVFFPAAALLYLWLLPTYSVFSVCLLTFSHVSFRLASAPFVVVPPRSLLIGLYCLGVYCLVFYMRVFLPLSQRFRYAPTNLVFSRYYFDSLTSHFCSKHPYSTAVPLPVPVHIYLPFLSFLFIRSFWLNCLWIWPEKAIIGTQIVLYVFGCLHLCFVANLLRKEFGAILFLSSVLCVLFGCFSVYPTFVAEGYYWFYFVCALRCFQFIFVFPKAATAAVPIVVVAATDAGWYFWLFHFFIVTVWIIFFALNIRSALFSFFFHSVHSHSRLFNPASVVCLFVFSSAPAFVVVHFNSFHFQFMWLCAVYALYLCQLVCSFVILYPSTTITLPLLNPHTYGCLLDALRLLRFYLYFACLFVVSCMSFNLCVFSLRLLFGSVGRCLAIAQAHRRTLNLQNTHKWRIVQHPSNRTKSIRENTLCELTVRKSLLRSTSYALAFASNAFDTFAVLEESRANRPIFYAKTKYPRFRSVIKSLQGLCTAPKLITTTEQAEKNFYHSHRFSKWTTTQIRSAQVKTTRTKAHTHTKQHSKQSTIRWIKSQQIFMFVKVLFGFQRSQKLSTTRMKVSTMTGARN